MKFIHTADWHLGKLVHGIYMTDDQRYILQELIQAIKDEKPDALVIAGDLYDRSVPPTDAVTLLNDTLYTINVELGVPVLAIAGNHDSADRVAFGASWYAHSGLHVSGKWTPADEPVEIDGVAFHLVPYSEPGPIRAALGKDGITSHHQAMEAVVASIREKMDSSKPNVLVGHAFVLGGTTSDSERTLSVGGSGCVGADVFAPFMYTALGHLHSPDAIHHPSIHYAGSPLKYSFSEAKQRKLIKIVELTEGEMTVRERLLVPKKDMREIEGSLAELMDPSFYKKQAVHDYLKVTLTDEGALVDPMNRLRQVYPNVLHLERKVMQTDQKKRASVQLATSEEKSDLTLFQEFYEHVTTSEWTGEKAEAIGGVMDELRAKEESK